MIGAAGPALSLSGCAPENWVPTGSIRPGAAAAPAESVEPPRIGALAEMQRVLNAPSQICVTRRQLISGPVRDCVLQRVGRVYADPQRLSIQTSGSQPMTALWSQVRGTEPGRDADGEYLDLLLESDQLARLYFQNRIARDQFAAALTDWRSSVRRTE